MIYTVYLNPTIDKTVYFEKFEFGSTNRPLDVVQDAAGKALNVSVVLAELKKHLWIQFDNLEI